MADPDLITRLRSGVEKWNEWKRSQSNAGLISLRGAILKEMNLVGADFSEIDLEEANFASAKLSGARFFFADLYAAQFWRADLSRANLSGAWLSSSSFWGANLSEAHLGGSELDHSILINANLQGANLNKAQFRGTVIAGVNLATVRGLRKAAHLGPSYISVDTLEMTALGLQGRPGAHDVEYFLDAAGVEKEYIELFRSRIGQPIQFYSCFISYSTKDQDFADRLYADLRQQAIKCWLATEDLKIGDRFRTRINDAIRVHDKLLVVLSETSIKSAWVEDEVEAAMERERRNGETVLFPIRLDDAIMHSTEAWAESIRRTRQIGDFTKWKDHDQYRKALDRLVRDLRPEKENFAL